MGMRLIGTHNTKLPGNWKSYIRIMSKFQKFTYRTLTWKPVVNSNNCPVQQIGPGSSFHPNHAIHMTALDLQWHWILRW